MNDSQLLLEKLEDMFGDEPFGPIEEELFQWFLFAYTGNGKGIKDLDAVNFDIFKEQFTILIETVYQWHRDEKQDY
jgi:hypothetical protein